MGDAALKHRTYQRAAELADKLLAEGLPVIGFKDFDGGAAMGFLLQKGTKPTAIRVHAEAELPEIRAKIREAVHG